MLTIIQLAVVLLCSGSCCSGRFFYRQLNLNFEICFSCWDISEQGLSCLHGTFVLQLKMWAFSLLCVLERDEKWKIKLETHNTDSRAGLTIFNISKSVHKGQPHEALRGGVCHQHIQKRVQHDLLLETKHTQVQVLEKCSGWLDVRSRQDQQHRPAGGSTSAPSAPCSRTRGPRTRPWGASAPPAGTGRTLQTS